MFGFEIALGRAMAAHRNLKEPMSFDNLPASYQCPRCHEWYTNAHCCPGSSLQLGPGNVYEPTSDTKPTNPKDAIGSTKLPLHLVPETLQAFACPAFAEGASKYGAYNWRAAGVRSSIYYDALRRHVGKWWNGEDCDPKTGVPHLSNAIACLTIILDAELVGKLNDDRPPRANLGELIEKLEAQANAVIALHAGKKPHHWTISDEIPK